MKTITKFQTDDGCIFSNIADAAEYEKLLNICQIINNKLKSKPESNDCSFENGEGYIQQDNEIVEKAKEDLLFVGRAYLNLKGNISFHWIGRYFDDSGVRCLYSLWGRLSNIDNLGREWGQQYYKLNPSKGKQIEL